jgi:hypothetical protein
VGVTLALDSFICILCLVWFFTANLFGVVIRSKWCGNMCVFTTANQTPTVYTHGLLSLCKQAIASVCDTCNSVPFQCFSCGVMFDYKQRLRVQVEHKFEPSPRQCMEPAPAMDRCYPFSRAAAPISMRIYATAFCIH